MSLILLVLLPTKIPKMFEFQTECCDFTVRGWPKVQHIGDVNSVWGPAAARFIVSTLCYPDGPVRELTQK